MAITDSHHNNTVFWHQFKVTDEIYSKRRLFHYPTIAARKSFAKVNTINNCAEVNYIVHAVNSTKHRMVFNLKYAVKHYN